MNPEMQGPPRPTWDVSAPAASLRRLGAWINEVSRAIFLKDGFHIEVFFLYRADGQGGIIQPRGKEDRDQYILAIKDAIKHDDIYGVVHVCEARISLRRDSDDRTRAKPLSGKVAASALDPRDRAEALTVRIESRDGEAQMWVNPVVRLKSGVALADAVDWPHPSGGVLTGFFGD